MSEFSSCLDGLFDVSSFSDEFRFEIVDDFDLMSEDLLLESCCVFC